MIPPKHMPLSRASSLMKHLTEQLALSVEEMIDLRDQIDAHLRKRVGVPGRSPPPRTLYLPADPLDDL